ncbi:MAG: class D beta-lactamase, partial [Bacteroidetes bacterium]|nr:class D beta-lactamase [Bacteroidota bacterium]
MKYLSFAVVTVVIFFSCSPNNVKTDNSLKKYFDENKVDGCFGLYNNGSGEITVYNL